MKGLGTRVQVLERGQPVGCATCRRWSWAVINTEDEAGKETGRSRPERCPACGREVAVEHVLRIIGVPWDAV